MKRPPALRQLSSDHHSSLVLAQESRRAARGGIHAQRCAWTTLVTVTRFRAELEPYFQIEETGILVALSRGGKAELVERTLTEHEDMRGMIAQDPPENLVRFAERLTVHVRFEEQVLVARAQDLPGPDQLAELVVA